MPQGGELAVEKTSAYAEELLHGDDLRREQLNVLRKPYQQADPVMDLREILADDPHEP